MNKYNKRMLTAGAVMVGLSSYVPNPFLTNAAMANPTAKADVTMIASIANPLAITESASLNWGAFAVAGAGHMTVKLAGATQSVSKGFGISKGTVGKVHLSAPNLATFSLTIAKFTAASLTLKGGTTPAKDTLTVPKLTFKGTAKLTRGGGASASGTFKKGGANFKEVSLKIKTGSQAVFNYVGRVNFASDQSPGAYTGTFTMVETF